MISQSALEQSIREASEAVRSRQQELSATQARMIEAQRELRLLVELAELRGLSTDRLDKRTANNALAAQQDGSDQHSMLSQPATKESLMATVSDILAEHGEPMQIRDLMAAVQERGVPIPGSGQQANLIAHISRDERIARPRRGFYALREWGIEDARPSTPKKRRRTGPRTGASA